MTDETPDDASSDLTLLRELSRVLEPVTDVADEPGRLLELLDTMGISQALLGQNAETILTVARTQLLGPIAEIRDAFEAEGGPTADDVPTLLSAVEEVFTGIRTLGAVTPASHVDGGDLATQVVDYLLIRYLRYYHSDVLAALRVGGVVTVSEVGRETVRYDQIGALLRDPNAAVSEAVGWGSGDFEAELVLTFLSELLWGQGVPNDLEFSPVADPPAPADTEPPGATGGTSSSGSPADASASESTANAVIPSLRVPLLVFGDGSASAGLRVLTRPGATGDDIAAAVVPYGQFSQSMSYDIGDGWSFDLQASGEMDELGLAFRPEGGPAIEAVDGDGMPDFHASAGVRMDGTADGRDGRVLLGSGDGSRLSLDSLEATATFDHVDDETTFGVAIPVGATLALDPSNLDGFLRTILPPDGVSHEFDVTVGWASDVGLFFERGGDLEAALPQHARFGPVELNEIYLAAQPPAEGEEGPIRLDASASASVELGPVTASIGRMGLSADLDFPEDATGNFGPVDLDLGFQPPRRIGLSVDAAAVTGGGFLEFDPEHERYAGVVDLQIGSLSLKAIGLLTTRLSDGEEGFSLLIMVTAEGFTPVQLGLGFTLNGVGGLVGINRRLNASSLLGAVRSGSMDSVLFPKDPVANASRIISDLRNVFPPTNKSHVVGPMVRLGWGTPSMLTADLGIVLELPSGRLAVLGRVQTVLPHEEAAVIDLQMDGAGVLKPAEQRAAFDATLVDSRVATWAVRGEMAMRTQWGASPRIAVSAGGFNPRFQPPTDFPSLKPVRLAFGVPGGNPSVSFEGYFALTSNTAQTGASMTLHTDAGVATVDGHLAFDALFQFDPFTFVADFRATLKATAAGQTLGITATGTVLGPAPVRLTGSFYVDALGIVVEGRIDETFGHAVAREELPPADVHSKLVAAFETPSNWTAQQPEGGDALVSLRSISTDDATILAHPLGSLRVRQSVVPLDLDIDTFGGMRPAKSTRFTIDEVTVEGEAALDLGETTREQFARAQFQRLSDRERLASPAFEPLPAGRAMVPGAVYRGYDDVADRDKNTRTLTLTYETTVIDRGHDNWATPLETLGSFTDPAHPARVSIPAETARALSEQSAAAKADTRMTGLDRYTLSAAEHERDGGLDPETGEVATKLSVTEATYVVARTSDLVRMDIGPEDASEATMTRAEAEDALERHLEKNPGRRGDLRVVDASRARTPATDGGCPDPRSDRIHTGSEPPRDTGSVTDTSRRLVGPERTVQIGGGDDE